MMKTRKGGARGAWALAAMLLVLGLAACDGSRRADPVASSGQVAPPSSPAVSFYAASRFAEQASFGPTPALVAELRSKGFERWIDDQFALPASQMDPSPYQTFTDSGPERDAEWRDFAKQYPGMAISAPDQLRVRLSWALSQWLVVSHRKTDLAGMPYWVNLLLRNATGNYRTLLQELSISPAMGVYLDNNQNRPKSAECPFCAPNENFARELMQLFSIGVFKLNPDGTPIRDANGAFVESYSQRDVEELARVLTGWTFDPNPANRPGRNYGNWSKPMVPTTWPPERDSGAKTVLGTAFPAGQTQAQDLAQAVSMLMDHPNIAPFVALRLIQNLVKSNPTPAYVGRVAAAFRNNGSGVSGDMKAVVKAVLLDAEARAGDAPAGSRRDDGRFREPFLFTVGALRGMGCARVPYFPGHTWSPYSNQTPFNAESVFGWYAPTDRAPGSNLLAPEQKMLNSQEFSARMSSFGSMRWNAATQTQSWEGVLNGGCDLAGALAAFSLGSKAYADWLSERYFRGAMPPSLRVIIDDLFRTRPWDHSDPYSGPVTVLDFTLNSPQFGIVQ